MEEKQIIGWWSGGITSAVTCKIIIDIYGLKNCRFVFIDTNNEDEDTYRFKNDCEKWYGKEIETISRITALSPDKRMDQKTWESIEEIWLKNKSLNTANGAICSSELKRDLRKKWQKINTYDHQAFGFDIDEVKRAKSMSLNYPEAFPIYPLLMYAYRKKDCIKIIQQAGIEVPKMYKLGFLNNNCFKTGCVQGGIGYWQKMKREYPEKYEKMAAWEHKLTDLKGNPVTICKDQSNNAKDIVNETGDKTLQRVFLKAHPSYPHLKDITEVKGREPEPMVECNGLCGINDLSQKPKEKEADQLKMF